ncbi:hypothetical protein [Actinomadura sp. SCN-SB]|uniref:hypothetical protein n=1 Tax=Actinomadura sp. SCN-SB TaxID=3373092 RepID=UPI003751530B
MQINPVTVPGAGTLHHLRTRHGQRLGVLLHAHGERVLFIYDLPPDGGGAGPGEAIDPDSPGRSIVLDADEADQLAQLLHDQPITDRLAELERRLAELERRG